MGAEPVLGADNKPLAFLRQRFPDLDWIKIPGFEPEYQKKGSLSVKIAASIPKMMKEAARAHELLEKLILLTGILSSGKPVVRKMINNFIIKHDELWIPDFKGEPNLSGKLSHVLKMPLENNFFIGPLSRFEGKISKETTKKDIDVLCLLSGPEPQRTIFENILIKQLMHSGLKTVILSGKPDVAEKKAQHLVEVRSHAEDKEMLSLLQSAKTVICRSGYSSIMDLVTLGKKAILVPTPGQPEQEYLAKKLKSEGLYYSCNQKEFSLEKAMKASEKYSGWHLTNDYEILKKRIKALLEKIS